MVCAGGQGRQEAQEVSLPVTAFSCGVQVCLIGFQAIGGHGPRCRACVMRMQGSVRACLCDGTVRMACVTSVRCVSRRLCACVYICQTAAKRFGDTSRHLQITCACARRRGKKGLSPACEEVENRIVCGLGVTMNVTPPPPLAPARPPSQTMPPTRGHCPQTRPGLRTDMKGGCDGAGDASTKMSTGVCRHFGRWHLAFQSTQTCSPQYDPQAGSLCRPRPC